MKLIIKTSILVILLASSLVFIVSCKPAPYCKTDLVTLDETRLELVICKEDVAKTGEQVKKLEEDIAEVDRKISNLEGKPEKLKRRIDELRKGSGLE
ncbi:MAG TPA: hypothetical protein VKO43_07290 [Candidatus Krumholzibacteriaceae bacterium]|nr:hypothetical protein [Candidatus Krumholzibacteriaceae bacterium]